MGGINIDKLRGQHQAQRPKDPVTPSIRDLMDREISFGSSFGNAQKEAFYNEASILLSAGLDLKSALDLILSQRTKKREARVIAAICDALVEGQTMAQALQAQGYFGPYEYHSVHIGEETGRLAEILDGLADYYRRRIKQKRQLVSALMYPCMVALTSIGAVFFMLHFIVPMFADIFRRSGNDLPYVTQLILDASAWIKDYGLLVPAGIAAAALGLYLQRKKEWYRKYRAQLLLKLPIFGQMARKLYLTRFCNAMALLTTSKVPLVRALELCQQMVGFYPIESSLGTVRRQVMEGKPLYQSLAAHAIYDARLVSLVKVGEEVNQLGAFFTKVSLQYQEEVDHRSAMISSLMEPFIIIFLGLLVGFILIAMYLPLFQMGTGLN